MIETRSAPRFRVTKPGRIEDAGFAISCTIRDLSVAGANVEVTELNTKVIPSTFDLIVPEDGLTLGCRIVWRKPFRIGVEFI